MKHKYFAAILALVAMAFADNTALAAAPIMEAEGDVVTYSRQGRKYYPTSQYMVREWYYWDNGEVVFADNDDVYLKDPVTDFRTGAYIKGKKQGDKIVFELPQLVRTSDAGGEYREYYVDRRQYDYEGDPTFLSDGKHTIEFRYIRGTLTMENASPDVGFAIVDEDGNWLSKADVLQEWVPFDAAPMQDPGVTTQSWAVHHSLGDFLVDVGFKGDKCYIRGISPNFRSSWIEGDVYDLGDGTKQISFESGQYLGVSSLNWHTFFMAGFINRFQGDSFDISGAEQLILIYDPIEGTMVPAEDSAFIINPGNDYVQYVEYYYDFTFERQGDIMITTPGAPKILWVQDYTDEAGCGIVRFEWPAVDVDGTVMPTNRLGCRVYVDNELYGFSPEVYPSLPYLLTSIPYGFTDGFDFLCNASYHQFAFYFEDYKTISLQSVYIDAEGREHLSDMEVYGSSSIKSAALSDVVETEYYDMQGRRVSQPQSGMCIKIERMADGSSRVTKLAR